MLNHEFRFGVRGIAVAREAEANAIVVE